MTKLRRKDSYQLAKNLLLHALPHCSFGCMVVVHLMAPAALAPQTAPMHSTYSKTLQSTLLHARQSTSKDSSAASCACPTPPAAASPH
jgi:hypothetical protein